MDIPSKNNFFPFFFFKEIYFINCFNSSRRLFWRITAKWLHC